MSFCFSYNYATECMQPMRASLSHIAGPIMIGLHGRHEGYAGDLLCRVRDDTVHIQLCGVVQFAH